MINIQYNYNQTTVGKQRIIIELRELKTINIYEIFNSIRQEYIQS